MAKFEEKNLAPWQTVEGQKELSDWRSSNMGRDYVEESSSALDLSRTAGEAAQAGIDTYEALAAYGSRNSPKYVPLLGKGFFSKFLPALSYGMNVANRESALKQAYYGRVHSPRSKTLGEHIENTYNYGINENFKPGGIVGGAISAISPGFGMMLNRSPKAMLESVPALIPFGDSVFNVGTSMLPESMGGRMKNETRSQYYQRTGRDIGDQAEAAGEKIGEQFYGTGRFRKMTDEELYNHINADRASKNYEGVGYSL